MTNFVPINNNFRNAFAHGEMNPRKRSTMEDVHRVVEALDGDIDVSYFGVYDGHGGRKIADFLEFNLEKHIAEELKAGDEATIEERLGRAFLITDVYSREVDVSTSGATAVSCLVCKQSDGSRVLYSANVGDSRAILCCKKNGSKEVDTSSSYYGKRLTFDHRPDVASELTRIQEAGGFIARDRVLGILAVTRAFGDHGMKQFVVADPYISKIILNDEETVGDCPFLILACDGVWDVMSDQEAVDLLYKKYIENNKEPVANAAEYLVQLAIAKGSTDNVTAIVVFL